MTTGKDDTTQIYKDKAGEYRWRRKAVTGEIVGGSTEGYKNRGDCKNNLERMYITPKPKAPKKK